jgi:hypothetical protein
MNLTINECKVLWVVGAAERLATLGMLSPDVPLKLSADAVDDFIEIDNHRDKLFPNDFEIAQIFKAIAKTENEYEVDDEDTNSIIDLILEYKNNRTEIVKYALSHQTV